MLLVVIFDMFDMWATHSKPGRYLFFFNLQWLWVTYRAVQEPVSIFIIKLKSNYKLKKKSVSEASVPS